MRLNLFSYILNFGGNQIIVDIASLNEVKN